MGGAFRPAHVPLSDHLPGEQVAVGRASDRARLLLIELNGNEANFTRCAPPHASRL
jgi:hypothetical protein